MTRYVMVVDLRRCVGCQTCTVSCRHVNATPPGVQWRQVLDIESGEYPDVHRTFMPVGCMHCGDPPCMQVCPSTATYQRDDGLVGINYELCIGCGYCAVACPYQARHIVHRAHFAFGEQPTAAEAASLDEKRISVATKCTFCIGRIDESTVAGLTPGVHPEVTPACVNSCIAEALCFGDKNDLESNVAKLIKENEYFRMHEDLGTDPGMYYLSDERK